MVPLRFILDSLEAKMRWHSDIKAVEIAAVI